MSSKTYFPRTQPEQGNSSTAAYQKAIQNYELTSKLEAYNYQNNIVKIPLSDQTYDSLFTVERLKS